jgi:pimeloyl-ACP methyl ester carboxylesterase
MSDISYSPNKVDLFFPARRGEFFSTDLPATEAGLCAEMARLAYCRQEPDFFSADDRISQILKGIGFTCQFFESKGTPNGRGTHCLLAVHEDSDPLKKLAVVAFRGTDSDDPTDLLDDGALVQTEWRTGGLVHSGFADALAEVEDNLLQALELTSCRVLITGHSLGAATATLLASLRRPDHLYTFGSPRVGNDEFVAALSGVKASRFVDCCDMVTRVPPATLLLDINYEHFGTLNYIDRNRQITLDPPEEYMREDRLKASEEYILNYGWKTGNVGVRELADHAPINYVTAVNADLSQPRLARWSLAASLGNSC